MAQMCAKLLRRRGHSAVIADSSVKALTIVRSGADVDAVLSDVQMPNMSGVQLLSELREIDGTLPVILMTGYASALSSAEARSLGATDYLTKPFNAETLIGAPERSLRHEDAREP